MPEVVKLVSLQVEIFSQPIEVEKLLIKIFVDLPAEPAIKLVPSLSDMRTSLFLRSPGEYNPLQIFIKETVS